MKTRTLLVDASYLLKRSFSGAKTTYTSKFGHIGGLYQFFTKLRQLVKEYKINKIVLAWDGENGGIYRYRIDPSYKANRKNKEWHHKIELSDSELSREKEKEISLLKQRKRIQAYAEELFIRQIEVDEIEADDLIAAYTQDNSKIEEIFLYTNDRDFAQLLDLDITILFANLERPITKSTYMMHFDHHYSNAMAIKIIEGDTADNIDGVGGLKEQTLIKLIPELRYTHLTVREICKKADDINLERIKNKQKPLKSLENLINNIPRLVINHKLIDLSKPMLNERAIEELEQLNLPLSPEGRSSKNLYKMMMEDDFLSVYGSTFPNYVEPFYTVIMNEKQLLTEYYKKRK